MMPGPIAEKLEGMVHIAGYSQISQAPIGRRNISHPASYINIWDKNKNAVLTAATFRSAQYTPGHFSFNASGACPECKGRGYERFWLGGNSFVTNLCPQCRGNRYLDEILDVTYKDVNIVALLNMSVTDAAALFRDIPSIHGMLSVLEMTGMGYITLGSQRTLLAAVRHSVSSWQRKSVAVAKGIFCTSWMNRPQG